MATFRPNIHAARYRDGDPPAAGALIGIRAENVQAPCNEENSSRESLTCGSDKHERLTVDDMVEENGSYCCPTCGMELLPILVLEDLDGRQYVNPVGEPISMADEDTSDSVFIKLV